MSGLFGFVVGGVADRLVPVLQTPVEDIIYEVLDQKGLPTRSEVRDLRNKLDRLEKTLADLTASLTQLKEGAEKAADDAERALEAAQSAAPKAKAPAQAKAAAPVAAKAETPAASAEAVASSSACKVDDCGKAVRARGFCAAHYQRFKRSTLEGYVGSDGTTVHENVRYTVGPDYSGHPVLTSYEGDEVLFLLPQADGKSVRVKVNDARID